MHSYHAVKITDTVYWVGAIDWKLRDFHGYSTSRGTTYNAFLILGDEPILVDTVKAPFYEEMLARISSIIAPEKIKHIISNHAEMDHSGSLLRAINDIKPDKIYASKMGVQALKQHFNSELPLTTLENCSELNIGGNKLQFVETRMLHWPDSMFTFYANDGILFSQDGFGMHLATTELFAEQNNQDILYYEAAKYYANILLPYSSFVNRLLAQMPKLNLDIKIIAPDHGPIWRQPEEIKFITKAWQRWSEQRSYQKTVIIYDTMWQSTEKMAYSIADGCMQSNINCKVLPLSVSNRSEIAVELLEAGALIIGSPTINQQIFPTLADAICYLKGLKRTNLIGQAFGSYGWAGEAIKILQNELTNLQITPVGDSISINYVPTNGDLIKCYQLGQQIADELKQRSK